MQSIATPINVLRIISRFLTGQKCNKCEGPSQRQHRAFARPATIVSPFILKPSFGNSLNALLAIAEFLTGQPWIKSEGDIRNCVCRCAPASSTIIIHSRTCSVNPCQSRIRASPSWHYTATAPLQTSRRGRSQLRELRLDLGGFVALAGLTQGLA